MATPQNRKIIEQFFIYQVHFENLDAGDNKVGAINIQADSDFRLQKMTYFADQDSAITRSTQIIPLVTVRITDTGSGRDLQSEAVPISTIMGTGEIPFILPQPRIFDAKSTISFNVANFSSAINYTNLYLVMIGSKLYY